MNNKLFLLILTLLLTPVCYATLNVHQKTLDNGLTILVFPRHTTPEVMINMVVGVGSRDEQTGEKGIAHLIEHMIFKGTENYSETDIEHIAYKLSARCNAATSYDYTHYWFNLPSSNWHHILPLMAEIMSLCSFKDDHLDSEFKVVIQELKMRNDDYHIALFQELMKLIFTPHPYNHPIIGYKKDLWNLHGSDLKQFYKKHYHPNNAALVIVGDVDPEIVFTQCQKIFAHLQTQPNYKREQFDYIHDIAQKSVVLYRAVKNLIVANIYCLPGSSSNTTDLYSLLGNILGLDTHTKIRKRLIDDEQLVLSCSSQCINLYDQSLFFINYEPKSSNDMQKIDAIIQDEISKVISNGIAITDIERTIKQNRSGHFDALQSNKTLAIALGNGFIDGNSPKEVLEYFEDPNLPKIQQQLLETLKTYVKPSVCHKGIVMPIGKDDAAQWLTLQEASDALDHEILKERIRTTQVEEPLLAHTIQATEPQAFNFAQPQSFKLNNNLNVLYHHNEIIPKIELILDLKITKHYDPEGKDGLCSFVSSMIQEGTKNYTKEQLVDAFESRGMACSISSGTIHISLLRSDLEVALQLLHETVVHATFPEESIEKIRANFHHSIDSFWDNPGSIARHLAHKHIYKNQRIGQHQATHATIDTITRGDLLNFYKKFYTPVDAQLAIVGDIQGYDIQQLVQSTLGSWHGEKIDNLEIKNVEQSEPTTLSHYIDRDQVVLFLIGNSIGKEHPDYDKILLFDQIFAPGLLGNMTNRLFMLRQQTGIFYSPQGSLLSNSSSYKGLPSMILFGSLISKDMVDTAETMLKQVADMVIDTITQKELEQAKRTIGFASAPYYSTNASIAHAFLYLNRLGLPFDYFNNRMAAVQSITLDEVKEAVKKVLHSSKLSTVKVGRI